MRRLLLIVLLTASAAWPADPGRRLFLERCAICHGEDGDGTGPVGATLPLKPRDFRHEPLQWGNSQRSVVETVTRGRQGVMPNFDEVLTAQEVNQVAAYVWSLIPAESKRRAAKTPTARSSTSRIFLIHQRNKAFTPTVVTARVGDTLVFVNEDEVEHEVHSMATDAGLTIQSQKPRQWDRVELSSPGVMRFGCAIHPSMRLEVKVEAPPPAPAPVEVRQKGQRFAPGEVTVPRGGTLVFVNDDDVAHNAFSKEGKFALDVQQPGERSPVTLEVPGTYEVKCAIHPGMKLKVKVK